MRRDQFQRTHLVRKILINRVRCNIYSIPGDPEKATTTQWEATKNHDSRGCPGHISLKIGDIVEEIEPPENGWVKVKNDRNEEGLVPLDFLGKKNSNKHNQM